MLIIKLELIKEFLIKNLKKRFIKLNTTLYASPVLFIIKKDKIKCFYIDYYKLNVFMRKNYYFILKINKML